LRWLRAANGGQGSQPVAAPAGGWQCSSLRIAMLDATGHEVQSAIRPGEAWSRPWATPPSTFTSRTARSTGSAWRPTTSWSLRQGS